MTSEALPESLLSRIEDAGLNASAPPQQRWMDGWLLRFSPGKAQRARCINAVATGRLPWNEKLDLAKAFYADRGLPLTVRITPFTLPAELDAGLAAAGYAAVDHTKVMVRAGPVSNPRRLDTPVGLRCESAGTADFAEAIGSLRETPAAQRTAHAERLLHAPVLADRLVVRRVVDGSIVACGQSASEAELVGLYDVYVRADVRKSGLAAWLCEHLLARAAITGATIGYLQVDGANHPARRLYAQLGFADAYGYHYRQPA